jgi:hypothetical protein
MMINNKCLYALLYLMWCPRNHQADSVEEDKADGKILYYTYVQVYIYIYICIFVSDRPLPNINHRYDGEGPLH